MILSFEENTRLIELQNLLDVALEESFGEVTDEVAALEDAIAGCFENVEGQLDWLVWRSEQLKAEAAVLREHSRKLADKARARENAMDRRKTDMQVCLRLLRTKKHKTATHTVWMQKSQRVKIDIDAKDLPDSYRKTEYKADRAALKKYIQNGGTLRGVTVEELEGIRFR